jgi:hypothetical protein
MLSERQEQNLSRLLRDLLPILNARGITTAMTGVQAGLLNICRRATQWSSDGVLVGKIQQQGVSSSVIRGLHYSSDEFHPQRLTGGNIRMRLALSANSVCFQFERRKTRSTPHPKKTASRGPREMQPAEQLRETDDSWPCVGLRVAVWQWYRGQEGWGRGCGCAHGAWRGGLERAA